MTDKQILEAQARILYYELWNTSPKVEDFKPGTLYQLLYGDVWLDRVIEPYALENQYCMMWLKRVIRERKIRKKNLVTTDKLKEFLDRNTILEFNFDEFDVLVARQGHLSKDKYMRMIRGGDPLPPMIWVKMKGTKYYVYENYLRSEWPTKLYKEWFNLNSFTPTLRKDWRYLLELDSLNPAVNSPTNKLWKYLKGVWLGDSIKLAGESSNWLSEEIKKGTLHTWIPYHEWPKVREQRKQVMKKKEKRPPVQDRTGTFATGHKRRVIVAKKAKKKDTLAEKYEGPRWSKAKPDEEVSDYVKQFRKFKAELLRNRALAEISKIEHDAKIDEIKMRYAKQKDSENRKLMGENSMVCVKNIETGEVDRVIRLKASEFVEAGTHTYVSKSVYKTYLNSIKEKPGLNHPIDLPRKLRRQKPDPVGYENHSHIQQVRKFEKDEQGNDIKEETVVRNTVNPIRIYVPEERRIWFTDPDTGLVRRVKKECNPAKPEFTDDPNEQMTEFSHWKRARHCGKLVSIVEEDWQYECTRKIKGVLVSITHFVGEHPLKRKSGAKKRRPNRKRRRKVNYRPKKR